MGGYVNLSDIEDRLKLYIFLQKQNLIKSKDSKKKGQIKSSLYLH